MVLERFTLSDGSEVTVPQHGVVLVVGPNNAGKSRALMDLYQLATEYTASTQVVRDANFTFEGNATDLEETLRSDHSIHRSDGTERVLISLHQSEPLANVMEWWQHGNQNGIARYFVSRADTESRLTASHPAQSVNLYESEPYHPLHRLYQNRTIEDRLNNISKLAFGRGVFLDTWSGGSSWSLRVGDAPLPESPRPSQETLDSIREQPLLQEQGDGVRSMLGLLLDFFTGHQSIALIDEPEAFLHPPQAKYLGSLLSEHARESQSLIVISTHSSDMVHGVLESSGPKTVIRIRRNGDVNTGAVLDAEQILEFWSDPLLRYSDLLEGLFSEGVILCEAEPDCKYYEAILDTISEEKQSEGTRPPDLHFTSCGGKHRLYTAVNALRAASVPVSVIADFDLINDWSTLSRIFTAAGGDSDSIKRDWGIVDAALRENDRNPTIEGFRSALNRELDAIDSDPPTPADVRRLREALRVENGWDRAKRSGYAAIPNGEPRAACDRLTSAMAEAGIHIVPVGEMESLVPTVGRHGTAWLTEVLSQNLHVTSDSDQAREFVGSVVAALLKRIGG